MVFAVPAASSKSKRRFSVACKIMTPRMTSLSMSTAKIEQLIIVKCNVQLLRVFGGKM